MTGRGAGIEELLAQAAVPTASGAGFDAAAAVHRLAAEASAPGHRRQLRDWQAREARKAQIALDWICQWSLTDAQEQLRRFAEGGQGLEPEGPFVFGCLLHRLGYGKSAQFWWRLAAGADHRGAAYCLHLHHLQLDVAYGASSHWYERYAALPSRAGSGSDGVAQYELLAAASRHRHRRLPPGDGVCRQIEDEVHRLAAETMKSCGVVGRPGRRFADVLATADREKTRRPGP
ncbi:hypothetical protein [Streptomyces sp. NPDC049555]|uniref:hypothetical protein n=1 Tax=unclassified Streptomyces TaxID=2593676 RepID=UPI00343F7703